MSTPVIPAIPAQRQPPHTDLNALSRALDHMSSAGWVLRDGQDADARRLVALAAPEAARAFPAGSDGALALAVILRVLRGRS